MTGIILGAALPSVFRMSTRWKSWRPLSQHVTEAAYSFTWNFFFFWTSSFLRPAFAAAKRRSAIFVRDASYPAKRRWVQQKTDNKGCRSFFFFFVEVEEVFEPVLVGDSNREELKLDLIRDIWRSRVTL